MNKIFRKFIPLFIISFSVYYLSLIIETISLYYDEYGFDIKNGIIVSINQAPSLINFSVFLSIILVTASLSKQRYLLSKIFKFGLLTSLILGGVTFILSNNFLPKLEIYSLVNRYEKVQNEVFSSKERLETENLFKKNNLIVMDIDQINHYSDSLEKNKKYQKEIITNLSKKIPDSIITKNFSEKEILDYGFALNNSINNYNQRDLFKLQSEIVKIEVVEKNLRRSFWKKSELYLNSFLAVFLTIFGIVIGANFKNEKMFSLICIGILIYSLILELLIIMKNYFVNEENLIGMLFRFLITLVIFLYLIIRLSKSKNTGANTV